jgi:hypothetical protein
MMVLSFGDLETVLIWISVEVGERWGDGYVFEGVYFDVFGRGCVVEANRTEGWGIGEREERSEAGRQTERVTSDCSIVRGYEGLAESTKKGGTAN